MAIISNNLIFKSSLNLSVPSTMLSNSRCRRLHHHIVQSPPSKLSYCCVSVTSTTPASSSGSVQKEDIVIVGAGIAGLATALSLHRLGIGSVVLEQSDSLRTGGTSLTLFKNGWGILDALGVGSELRSQFLEIQGMVLKTDRGRELRSFTFKDADKSQEVRAVERRILLQTLTDALPSDSVKFSSKVADLRKSETGETILQLTNGTRLSAKIIIGCDGIRSPIARWMGFREPNYVGYSAIRGLGYYPQGQPLPPRVTYVYGKGLRAGYVPVSSTKVYWFICYNVTPPGPKITDPLALKKQALSLLKNWASDNELLNIIDSTPEDTLIRTPLEDRWLWPVTSPSVSKDNVVLVGDAWHPMTPNLGQGGCCALEDAIVLAKKLHGAIKLGHGSVQDAFEAYESDRWLRIFPMTVRANLVGSLLQLENPLVCAVRDNVVVPKLVQIRSLLEHTNFEIQSLS